MKKHKCAGCDYIYDAQTGDSESNIPPGTDFDELPDDWMCPLCGLGKEDFEPIE